MSACTLPPRGYLCNLPHGHDGPCPSWPTLRTALVSRLAWRWPGARAVLLRMWFQGRFTRKYDR